MKSILLVIAIDIFVAIFAHASGAITVEITTTDSEIIYSLHRKGYGNDVEKDTTPAHIEKWLHATIPQISDPRLIIYIYTDDRTPFSVVIEMLRHIASTGAKRFAICVGSGAHVNPALLASFEDIRIDFVSRNEAEQGAAANP